MLALAAAAAATDAASAQAFDPAARDIRTGVYQGQLVTYEVIDGLAIWDGDIILGTPEELSPFGETILAGERDSQTKILTVSNKRELWPGGVIPYTIDPDLANPHIPAAIRHWEEKTLIRLVERTNQPNWVIFNKTEGRCSAAVGMVGGEQGINLRDLCGLGTVIHEIGHAAGLWHEQQRNDRDRHIFVDPHLPWYEHPLGFGTLDSGPYDYRSVMHAGCGETRVTIPPGILCGSDALSAADIDGVSRLYGEIPAETTITTNPVGLLIEVDGETYAAPHSFDWAPGSEHTISVPAPQRFVGDRYFAADQYRFLFAKWSDGGAQTHSVTASSETTVFIANFILQTRTEYRAGPAHGGTIRVEPPSADGYYSRFATLKMFAEPAEGFSFSSWGRWSTGIGPASNPKVTTRVNSNDSAFFTRQLLTKIDTNVPGITIAVDGAKRFLPQNFAWEAGSTHTLGLLVGEETDQDGVIQAYLGRKDERLVFDGWSDGGADTHDITITEERPTITANFRRQVALDTGRGPAITVDPPGSDGGYHDLSSTVSLTADLPNREFVSWLGDLSGSENPKSLLMDSPKRVAALFIDWEHYRTGKIVPGEPISLRFGTSTAAARDYWIVVPQGATKLEVHLETNNRRGAIDLHANHGSPAFAVYRSNRIERYGSAHSSTGTSRDKSIVITPESSPPLQPGPYFIKVHQRTDTGQAQGKLRVNLTVVEAEIAAKTPHFGIPASLITTREGEAAPPQILEVRNSGRGTLDYEIATDQPWLSVSTDQGSAMEETDVIEIRADPTAMEPGAFEGTITITERPPAEGFAGLFSDHTPAWPVKVPVTLVVIPESWEDPLDITPTMPEEGEDDSEGEEEESEDNEDESGGLAVETRLRSPWDVAVDTAGNLYIADSINRRIRRVDSSGAITTVAGTGVEGYTGDGGPAVDAQLSFPASLAVDAEGQLFIAELFEHRIRRVDSSGIITSIAGTGEEGFSGDGGPSVEAQLSYPRGVAVDAAGNVFIADARNQRIRKVDPSGTISTYPRGHSSDGVTLSGNPGGVAVDAAGNLFFTDTTKSNVYRVDSSGIITHIAGVWSSGYSGDGGPALDAHLRAPSDVAVDAAGNVYIADEYNHRIRRVDSSGIITTIAGTGVTGFSGDGGPAAQARLAGPRGVAVDAAGNVYIADYGNQRIRKVDPSGTITTIAGRGE